MIQSHAFLFRDLGNSLKFFSFCYNETMKEIAIIGSTASGKSALAVEIAQKVHANILSLDSLSIYKGADIVSAKPTIEEQGGIRHFGLDILEIDAHFSAGKFIDLYHEARDQSRRESKHLIITGGSGFYLKMLLEGLSQRVEVSQEVRNEIAVILHDLESAYEQILRIDSDYAQKISPHDRYRVGKWYEIYLSQGVSATDYFQMHRPQPKALPIEIFEIQTDRKELRKKIEKRTQQMISLGLVEEIFHLEKQYGRAPHPMKAIGIVETLGYLDGQYSLEKTAELITTHTAQLAKRQEIFNHTQFSHTHKDIIYNLKNKLLNYF